MQGGITEIAAILHDGTQEIASFQTLINPERFIPNFITGLTGIDQDMVSGAPTFGDIAEKLFEFLTGHVFVAHNVNFDYSFIREAFRKVGITYDAPKLCTVRLSRKIFPGYRSYGLGRICEHLAIKIENRHRAMGDAAATAILFSMLYATNSEVILAGCKRNNGETFLPPHISKEQYQKIPEATGVYYFHDNRGDVIYIGKAKNIRSRFKGHFSGSSQEKLRLKTEIHDISWQLTGNEFLAYLIEVLEIRHHWPKYNRALKFKSQQWGLYLYEDGAGFLRFQIAKNQSGTRPIYEFDSHSEGWKFLMTHVESYELCPKLSGIQKAPKACHDYTINKCKGACFGQETPLTYNKKVNQFLGEIQQNKGAVLIREKGIYPQEDAALLFENGIFKGYGFFKKTDSISNQEEVLDRLTKVKHLPETRYILRSFIPKINQKDIEVVR